MCITAIYIQFNCIKQGKNKNNNNNIREQVRIAQRQGHENKETLTLT
jgi:hypothetical protein